MLLSKQFLTFVLATTHYPIASQNNSGKFFLETPLHLIELPPVVYQDHSYLALSLDTSSIGSQNGANSILSTFPSSLCLQAFDFLFKT